MTEVNNLTDLRDLAVLTGWQDGEEHVYVKGHTAYGDGGGGIFVWRKEPPFTIGDYAFDNNGTIIQSTKGGIKNKNGRWVRQYDGYINVLFFGAFGLGGDYTARIQDAIDFAHLNSKDDPEIKGATVFIPNGSYRISKLILKHGVSILGESLAKTILYAFDGDDVEEDYMIEIDEGIVTINISRLHLSGQDKIRGGIRFKSVGAAPTMGGLWNSRISDIQIDGFRGNGLLLDGGGKDSDYRLPNQFLIFENVRIFKSTDYSNALRITGQQGQITFLNCEFDGFKVVDGVGDDEIILLTSTTPNVHILNDDKYPSAVISFINCTCQYSDYGFKIEYAENITIDNCWFEQLGTAILLCGKLDNNDLASRATITNNRFANAAGFGSIDAPNSQKTGRCIEISNSYATITNNFTGVSFPDSKHLSDGNHFILAYNNIKRGIAVHGNTFQVNKLDKTFGIMQLIEPTGGVLDCAGHKLVFAVGSTPAAVINTLKSSVNASEYITIRADKGPVTFTDNDNIILRASTLTLNIGAVATFVKVDDIVGTNYETYQLIAVIN